MVGFRSAFSKSVDSLHRRRKQQQLGLAACSFSSAGTETGNFQEFLDRDRLSGSRTFNRRKNQSD